MSRRYDSRTTEFSPEGRLHQLENAMEAVSKGGAAIGILAKDCIVFAAEKRITSKLIDFKTESEKLSLIDNHIHCLIAGLHADANTLIEYARKVAQNYRFEYQSAIPLEQLVERICDMSHAYTQFGGYRPFGTSFLLAGIDSRHGLQLYETDPSGNYSGWDATAIGTNSTAVMTLLKKEFKQDMDEENALLLGVKALMKALEVTTATKEKMEFAIMKKDTNDKVKVEILKGEKLEKLLNEAKDKIDLGE